VYSGRFPEGFSLASATEEELIVFDSIIKRQYLLNYKLKPDEVDKMGLLMTKIWDRVAYHENEKSILQQNENHGK
jgi:hypothetical protein